MTFTPGDRVVTQCPEFQHAGQHGTVRTVRHVPSGSDEVTIDLDTGGYCCITASEGERETGRSFQVGDRVISQCDTSTHAGKAGRVRSTSSDPAGGQYVTIELDDGGECHTQDLDLIRPTLLNPPDATPILQERSAVLKDADALINGRRQSEYGPPAVNFQRIADMWHVLFPERTWTPADVARAMAAVKLARTPEGFKRDTAVDLAGYAALYAELAAES